MKKQQIFTIHPSGIRRLQKFTDVFGKKWEGLCKFFIPIDKEGDKRICPMLESLYWAKKTTRKPDIDYNTEKLSCFKFYCVGIAHPDCPLVNYDITIKLGN